MHMWHTLLQAQSGVTIQAMWCIGVQQLYVTHMFSSTSQLQVRLTNAACSYDVTECPVDASLLGTRNYNYLCVRQLDRFNGVSRCDDWAIICREGLLCSRRRHTLLSKEGRGVATTDSANTTYIPHV